MDEAGSPLGEKLMCWTFQARAGCQHKFDEDDFDDSGELPLFLEADFAPKVRSNQVFCPNFAL